MPNVMFELAMSTCHGFQAAQLLTIAPDDPCFLIVGPTENVRWPDTIAAFVAHYHHVSCGGSVSGSIDVMNQVICRADRPLFQAKGQLELLVEAHQRSRPRP